MSLTGSAVTGIIAAQHLDVGRILETIGQTTGADRARQFQDLRVALAAHEAAEELAIHPRAHDITHGGTIHDRIAEEDAAADALASLEQLSLDSTEFDSAFSDFAAAVRAHARAEEADEWPIIESIEDTGIIDEMATTMRAVYTLTARPDQPDSSATYADILAWSRLQLPGAAAREPAPSDNSQRRVRED